MTNHVSQVSVRLQSNDLEKLEGIINVLYPLTGISEHTPFTLKLRLSIHLCYELIKDLEEDDIQKLREFIADLEL
jgi:hypothetical protein